MNIIFTTFSLVDNTQTQSQNLISQVYSHQSSLNSVTVKQCLVGRVQVLFVVVVVTARVFIDPLLPHSLVDRLKLPLSQSATVGICQGCQAGCFPGLFTGFQIDTRLHQVIVWPGWSKSICSTGGRDAFTWIGNRYNNLTGFCFNCSARLQGRGRE